MTEARLLDEPGRPARDPGRCRGHVGLARGLAAALGLGLGLLALPAHALDTVFLVDGGRVRGTVMVEDASGVSIKLPDGTVRTYKKSEVKEVRYDEAGVAPTPTPPPSAPPPPPAPTTPPAAPPAPSAPPSAASRMATCARDGDCAPGLGCDGRGQCVAPTALGPRCQRDADCAAGHGCNAQNVCVSFGGLAPTPLARPGLDGAPPGYRYESRPIKGLAAAGFLLFGATYVATVALAAPIALALDSRKVGESVAVAAIPVVGGVLSDVDFIEPGYGSSVPLGTVVSVVQLSGLVLGVVGLAVKRRTLVPMAALMSPYAVPGGGGLVLGSAW